MAPIPKPAPWRDTTPMEGLKMSRTANTAAAAIVTVMISSRGRLFRGMKTRARATATPSITYLITRESRSLTSIFIYIRHIDFFPTALKWFKVPCIPKTEMSQKKSEELVEDFLSEDPEIPSQKIVLLSFLSPEKILEKKDIYFFQQFMKDYDIQWKTTKFEQWLAGQIQDLNGRLDKLAGSLGREDASGNVLTPSAAAEEIRKSEIRVDRIIEDYEAYCRTNQKEIKRSDIQTAYDDFIFKNEQKLEDEYHKMNDFHTTIRGIKVRGVYSTEAEASARAKRLQKSDPNFNIYMGAVGKWMAWDPNPNNVTEQEYANEQLNTLMKKYRDNEEARDHFYTEQKKKKIGQSKTKNVEAEAEADSNQGSSAAGSITEQYGSMFDGPADLAISRKMENRLDKKD